MSRAPFVSGLPDAARASDARPDPRGHALLLRIRERAEAEIKLLAPLTRRRFDGEWIEPDDDDIATHAIACSTRDLIDAIVSDPALCRDLARILARKPGGR